MNKEFKNLGFSRLPTLAVIARIRQRAETKQSQKAADIY